VVSFPVPKSSTFIQRTYHTFYMTYKRLVSVAIEISNLSRHEKETGGEAYSEDDCSSTAASAGICPRALRGCC
jgi:hypothetical protein